jgi:hypothetical protein
MSLVRLAGFMLSAIVLENGSFLKKTVRHFPSVGLVHGVPGRGPVL